MYIGGLDDKLIWMYFAVKYPGHQSNKSILYPRLQYDLGFNINCPMHTDIIDFVLFLIELIVIPYSDLNPIESKFSAKLLYTAYQQIRDKEALMLCRIYALVRWDRLNM